MRQQARRRLTGSQMIAGIRTAVIAGSLVLGQAGLASAATAGPASRQTETRSTAGMVMSGSGLPGATYQPSGTTLKFGMRGPAVRALQQRLRYLHYYISTINGDFDWETQEAVWAFKEVQSGKIAPPHPNRVDGLTQHALVHPRAPKVLFPHGGSTRIEVNKKIEVLVLYKKNKVKLISHVSSASWCRPDGCGWFTPGGFHRALYYLPGKVPDASFGTSYMYWPVFFIGHTYAIHGFPRPKWHNRFYGVPLRPASHGCVRIPIGVSKVLHTMIHIDPTNGTPIWIYPVATPAGYPASAIRWLRPGHPG
jgi:hypothetical protein